MNCFITIATSIIIIDFSLVYRVQLVNMDGKALFVLHLLVNMIMILLSLGLVPVDMLRRLRPPNLEWRFVCFCILLICSFIFLPKFSVFPSNLYFILNLYRLCRKGPNLWWHLFECWLHPFQSAAPQFTLLPHGQARRIHLSWHWEYNSYSPHYF